ncbi:MAG: hypothetical protein IIZ97_03900, partial [Prevotella sp.]|nr:hypothetical protein [Prevotella sp.]
MKQIILLLFALMSSSFGSLCGGLAVATAQDVPDDFSLIENQPEGELRIYTRSGGLIREVEKEVVDENDPYELVELTQDGTVNIVFADNNKVYIQQPTSWLTIYDGWVEGTLSDDGTTITVPLGQYTAYTRSFNMATQLWLFNYVEELDSYVRDEETTEITYSIDADGTIRLNGTSRTHILGLCQRAFGETFYYLDYEWLQDGDFESVYTPVPDDRVVLPPGLEQQEIYFHTVMFDGVGLSPFNRIGHLAFDGDDVYLNGFNSLLPNAWIKGHRDGDNLVFPSDQFLGSYGDLLYFRGGTMQGQELVSTDLVFTYNGRDAYSCPDYLVLSTAQEEFKIVNYGTGAYFSFSPDQLITPPDQAECTAYKAQYQWIFDEEGQNTDIVAGEHLMNVCQEGDNFYVQGFWQPMPEAWIKGTLTDGTLTFNTPQCIGEVEIDENGFFPLFFTAYDAQNGTLLNEVTFTYNAETDRYEQQSAPISIGINKAVLLSVSNVYDLTFGSYVVPTSITSHLS